jgi:hypothetical protein
MEQLARDYADVADFFTVWVREAHAGGDFPQPENVEQREQYARAFVASDTPDIQILLDDMDGTLQALMGDFPNSVYVVDGRGVVVYRASWSDAREIDRVLGRLRQIAERREARVPLGMGRWSEESLPALHDDPDQSAVNTIEVWEEAKNYEEPEVFMGAENAERLRATYERVTGKQSIRPSG